MADKEKKKRRPSVAGKRVSVSHEAAPPRARALDLPELDPASVMEPSDAARPRAGAQSASARRATASPDAGRADAAPVAVPAASAESSAAPAGHQEGSRIAGGAASSKTGTPRMERGSKRRRPSRREGKHGISRRFVIVSSIVVVLLAVGCGLLAWNQWLRFDDAADIQGSWTVEGTEETITFTATDIVMTDEVSYPYTLDTFRKTIDFSFKQYSGTGSYAFSPERTTLVITEEDADTQESVSTKLVKE